MKQLFGIAIFTFCIFAFYMAGCGSDDSSPLDCGDHDQDMVGEQSGEGSLDGNSIFTNPMDGKLYAAAGARIITPSDENHPCDQFLGGTGQNRPAQGTHDDLEARVLLLKQDGLYAVFVSMDLVGWLISDVDKIWDALEERGVDRKYVSISSTHTHAGPDTIGQWGPNDTTSGRCPQYALFLVDTVVEMVEELAPQMEPVDLWAGEILIDEQGAKHPNLIADSRKPEITNDHLTVAKLTKENGDILVTVINWHIHPEVLISSRDYSADFPRWTRQKIEDELGGTCLYFSGTVGGLQTTIDVEVPARTEAGEPVVEGGEPVYLIEDDSEKNWSLGYVVAEYALEALDEAEKMEGGLTLNSVDIEIPMENFMYYVGFELELFEPYDGMILDKKDFCGPFGCFPHTIKHLSLGKFHIVTVPGEVLPETSVGRPASSHDYGGDWGIMEFPGITGYRSVLPEGHFLMEFGLSDNEIGYVLPESDFTPDEHPDHYEEFYSAGYKTESIVREGVIQALEDGLK